MPWKIFDIFMCFIDDFCQLFAINHLLINVHCDTIVKIWQAGSIVSNNFSDCRTPKRKSYTSLYNLTFTQFSKNYNIHCTAQSPLYSNKLVLFNSFYVRTSFQSQQYTLSLTFCKTLKTNKKNKTKSAMKRTDAEVREPTSRYLY